MWHLPPRHDRKLRFKPVQQPDPTPREIARACLEVQKTWDDATREARRVVKSQAVQLRRIELTDEARQAFETFGDE